MKLPSENQDPKQDLYEMGFRKTICVDFDGVIHFYGDGWKEGVIYDFPVPGSLEWLRSLIGHTNEKGEHEFEVAIYSSRSKLAGGVVDMQMWLKEYGMSDDELQNISFPTQKPAAWITIDDRCFQFRGEFPTVDYLNGYKAWNKRPIGESIGHDVAALREIADTYKQFPILQQRIERIANELEGKKHV